MSRILTPAQRQRKNQRDRLSRRRRIAAYYSMGLTWNGTPRKNRIWKECHGLPLQEQKNLRARQYTRELNALGLTKRRTPTKAARSRHAIVAMLRNPLIVQLAKAA